MSYKATIIIPCYNKKKYIARALDSIIALSRFTDFEVIVIDDGSTDGSPDIIRAYTEKYSNILLHCFEQGSGSPSKPRNRGIDMSTTDYLIFMDPDDQIINDGYSLLLTKMEELESDVLIAARVGIDESGNQRFVDYIDEKFTFTNTNSYRIQLDLLNRRPYILKTIYSKRLLEEHNIRFNETISTSEDESFDMLCAAHAKRITKINDIVYQYTYEAQNSITTCPSVHMYENLYEVMTELEHTYKLMFSDEITYGRIAALVDVFYLYRIAFLKTKANVDQACSLVFDAFERFGIDKFSCLLDRRRIELIAAIHNRDISDYVQGYMLKRMKQMAASAKKANRQYKQELRRKSKEIKTLKGELKSANRLLERKMVRPFATLARLTSSKRSVEAPHLPRKAPSLLPHDKALANFAQHVRNSSNGYWVFMDRPDAAKDNAEALYRYVMKNQIHDKLAFILGKDSNDYGRLITEGFNVIEYNTLEHWKLLQSAEYFFTAHCDGYIMYPWHYIDTRTVSDLAKQTPVKPLYKLVFLQHGVIRSNLSGWLGGKDFYKFVASTLPEYRSLLNIPNYRLVEEDVAFTGLARWDCLSQKDGNIIVIFPTWRKNIAFAKESKREELIRKSPFLSNWLELCKTDALQQLASQYEVIFAAHHDNAVLCDQLKELLPSNVRLVRYSEIKSFSELVSTAKMLITDYSSFSMDFLYLNKPVVYFDFDQNALHNNIKGMEYGRFGHYCTDVEHAEQAISSVVKSNFIIDDRFRQNIAQAFTTRQKPHCKSIIEAVTGSSNEGNATAQ